MGPERTQRKYAFVEELLATPSSSNEVLGMLSPLLEDEVDDDSDHIILEMEERRGAGSIFDQYRSLVGASNVFQHHAEEVDVSQIEYPGKSSSKGASLKRPRQDESVEDKHQVG
ncbi:unnamed protein product [Eruca vesicaria subsp. sativa]|uniref:Uncharacterized protein n=1 Tax=Eruca vesicaria subsp. sativa TaxID=29727 RepID=A0ABC8L3Y7_ERUVS|nr:unnamed protein product [Eruca vesicaria subsp. sativa]